MINDNIILFWSKFDKDTDVSCEKWLAKEITISPFHLLSLYSHIKHKHNVYLFTYQKIKSKIPNGIKYAQYELARALANDTDAITGTTGKDGNFSEVKLGDIQVKYNTDSQGTGSVNNILDVYPWLQSYLGAYMLGGAGSYQMRVVRG